LGFFLWNNYHIVVEQSALERRFSLKKMASLYANLTFERSSDAACFYLSWQWHCCNVDMEPCGGISEAAEKTLRVTKLRETCPAF
jgi:hypothetical protein